MRQATKEEKESSFEFIQNNEYAVLATASRLGTPSAATITYIADKDLNIYFFTRKSSRKGVNLRKNRKVSLVIGTGPESVSAQINGKVSELSEEETGVWMDEFLSKRNGFYMTFLKLEGYDFIGYKLTPKTLTWLQIAPGVRKEDIVEIRL